MSRFLPLIVFAIVLAIGLSMTGVVHNAEQTTLKTRFEVVADDAVDRIRERVTQHVAFLTAAHSFIKAGTSETSADAFSAFVGGLDLKEQFSGMQGIGFARMIANSATAMSEISRELAEQYDVEREVWPESTETMRTPIVLLEPDDERNKKALGYDMFSEPLRRAAMNKALQTGDPTASAPVELVQEITADKQNGFLVYVPLYTSSGNGVRGFVYAPFRAGDLHEAALNRIPQLPVVLKTTDVTDNQSELLFTSDDFDKHTAVSTYSVDRSLTVAGRTWHFEIHDTPAFLKTNTYIGTFTLGAISLFLALALALTTHAQLRAIATARALNAVSEKNLRDKDLLLQEMKHRIKNSIARVMAMARHTAANSEDLQDFTKSFTARLQSMANAQDMLTRSHWQRADLRELLSTELEQVFGNTPGTDLLSGPKVELSETAAQALSLTFHELATNALKYGAMSSDAGKLEVKWKISRRKTAKWLKLEWLEHASLDPENEPGRGFGTRLIDANIRGELGGTIEREITAKGMRINIEIPLKPA